MFVSDNGGLPLQAYAWVLILAILFSIPKQIQKVFIAFQPAAIIRMIAGVC
jgi:hypothetical protein